MKHLFTFSSTVLAVTAHSSRPAYALFGFRDPASLDLVPLARRQDVIYHPEVGGCRPGNTCVDACGLDFQECAASTNLALFCFNPSVGQTCCGDGDGRACDAGYYCARTESTTLCCLDTSTLEACAAAYNIPGEPISQLPPILTSIPSSYSVPSVPAHTSLTTTTTTTTAADPLTVVQPITIYDTDNPYESSPSSASVVPEPPYAYDPSLVTAIALSTDPAATLLPSSLATDRVDSSKVPYSPVVTAAAASLAPGSVAVLLLPLVAVLLLMICA